MKLRPYIFALIVTAITPMLSGCGGSSSSTTPTPDNLIGTLTESSTVNGVTTSIPLVGWTVTFNNDPTLVDVTSSTGTFTIQVPVADIAAVGNPLALTPPVGYTGSLQPATTTVDGLSTAGAQNFVDNVIISSTGIVTTELRKQ